MKTKKSLLLSLLLSSSLFSADVSQVPQIGMDLAMEVAKRTVESCRAKGYWVSAVVVDRSANTQVVLRDTHAPRFTMDIATKKANLVIMSGIDTASFVVSRADIKDELNNTDGLIMMEGGLAIKSGDTLLGAVGVSGAPGGDVDASCAKEGLASLKERLAFAMMSEDDE